MKMIVTAMMLVLPSAAVADEIAAKAVTCWELPAMTEALGPAEFRVQIDGDGRVADATVLNFKSDETRHRVFVMSAVRALMKCAPYANAGETVTVIMDPADIPPRGIDPFKE